MLKWFKWCNITSNITNDEIIVRKIKMKIGEKKVPFDLWKFLFRILFFWFILSLFLVKWAEWFSLFVLFISTTLWTFDFDFFSNLVMLIGTSSILTLVSLRGTSPMWTWFGFSSSLGDLINLRGLLLVCKVDGFFATVGFIVDSSFEWLNSKN